MDNEKFQISFEELQAIEALVYAARCHIEGNKSWITMEQSLEHLDKIRNLPQDNNQGTLFDNDTTINDESSSWVSEINKAFDRLSDEIDCINNNLDNILKELKKNSKKTIDNSKNHWNKDWRKSIIKDWDFPR